MQTQESETATYTLCLDQPPKNAMHVRRHTGVSWFGLWLTALTERLPLSICLGVLVALGSRFSTHQIPTSDSIHIPNNRSRSHSVDIRHTHMYVA